MTVAYNTAGLCLSGERRNTKGKATRAVVNLLYGNVIHGTRGKILALHGACKHCQVR